MEERTEVQEERTEVQKTFNLIIPVLGDKTHQVHENENLH